MNDRHLNQIETLKEFISNCLDDYSYTNDYDFKYKEDDEEVDVTLLVRLPSNNDEMDRHIRIYFRITEELIELNSYEDVYEEMDYDNYKELIWKHLFFEK